MKCCDLAMKLPKPVSVGDIPRAKSFLKLRMLQIYLLPNNPNNFIFLVFISSCLNMYIHIYICEILYFVLQ